MTRPWKFQELTTVIKQDITALNSAVVDLQLVSSSRNESGQTSTDNTTHSTTVVDDLKNRLMGTTKEFKDVLTMRTEVTWKSFSIFILFNDLYFCKLSTTQNTFFSTEHEGS